MKIAIVLLMAVISPTVMGEDEDLDIGATEPITFKVTKPKAVMLGREYLDLLENLQPNPNGRRRRSSFSLPSWICPGNQTCDPHARYRTADGSCNNLLHPKWGESFIPMRRFLPPQYDDGISKPRTLGRDGSKLPSPRKVSTTLHTAKEDSSTQKPCVSHLVMQWGQFLDHDFSLAPTNDGLYRNISIQCCPGEHGFKNDSRTCFPIEIPEGDHRFDKPCMNFVRSLQIFNANCTMFPGEQLNQVTAYIDGSMLYGSDQKEQNLLRTFCGGLLKTWKKSPEFLPKDNDSIPTCVSPKGENFCFKAGDHRVNEQMGLTSMHTIWLREHNRIARRLSHFNPHWNDERIFQETRRIVGAMIQHITYREFLPIVLSTHVRRKYNLIPRYHPHFSNVYDEHVDASVRNVFSSAAYRFGHSLIRPNFSEANLDFQKIGNIRLRDSFRDTTHMFSTKGDTINTIIRGLVKDRTNKVDRHFTRDITDFLFLNPNGHSLDLISMNIQRGRDHGIPGYNAWREWCGLPRAERFDRKRGGLVDHPQDVIDAMKKLYKHPDDIDLFSAGVSERPFGGALLGRTLSCIVGRQFEKLKVGDRFWYEREDEKVGFTEAQLRQIRRSSLSRVICDNTDTIMIQRRSFRSCTRRFPCRRLGRIKLKLWKEHP